MPIRRDGKEIKPEQLIRELAEARLACDSRHPRACDKVKELEQIDRKNLEMVIIACRDNRSTDCAIAKQQMYENGMYFTGRTLTVAEDKERRRIAAESQILDYVLSYHISPEEAVQKLNTEESRKEPLSRMVTNVVLPLDEYEAVLNDPGFKTVLVAAGVTINPARVLKAVNKGRKVIKEAGNNLPVPKPTTVKTTSGETLTYQSNAKHSPGHGGQKGNESAGIEPKNSLDLFTDSVSTSSSSKRRYAQDAQGNVHEFKYSGDNTWHWSASSNDINSPLSKDKTPRDILDKFGINKKGVKWK